MDVTCRHQGKSEESNDLPRQLPPERRNDEQKRFTETGATLPPESHRPVLALRAGHKGFIIAESGDGEATEEDRPSDLRGYARHE
jgi:hypothetical protein